MMKICLVSVLAAFAAILAGCGSTKPALGATAPGRFDGLVLNPRHTAPPIVLRDYTGHTVSLRADRGRAVFLTFLYVHCPDVCPLMAAALARAQSQLGDMAGRVRILAVSVDPKGDTPESVRRFLAARDAIGRVDYLIGTRRQLAPIWHAYGIATSVHGNAVSNGHTAVVFGITPQGKIVVVYPSNFTPPQIVHDVPLLLRG